MKKIKIVFMDGKSANFESDRDAQELSMDLMLTGCGTLPINPIDPNKGTITYFLHSVFSIEDRV